MKILIVSDSHGLTDELAEIDVNKDKINLSVYDLNQGKIDEFAQVFSLPKSH